MVKNDVGRSQGELKVNKFMECDTFCLQCFDTVGWATEGYPACKKQGVGLLVMIGDCSFALLVSPVVTTTSIIVRSSEI